MTCLGYSIVFGSHTLMKLVSTMDINKNGNSDFLSQNSFFFSKLSLSRNSDFISYNPDFIYHSSAFYLNSEFFRANLRKEVITVRYKLGILRKKNSELWEIHLQLTVCKEIDWQAIWPIITPNTPSCPTNKSDMAPSLIQDGAEHGSRVASSEKTLQFFICFICYFVVLRAGCC